MRAVGLAGIFCGAVEYHLRSVDGRGSFGSLLRVLPRRLGPSRALRVLPTGFPARSVADERGGLGWHAVLEHEKEVVVAVAQVFSAGVDVAPSRSARRRSAESPDHDDPPRGEQRLVMMGLDSTSSRWRTEPI
jgi:hypothetical protein